MTCLRSRLVSPVYQNRGGLPSEHGNLQIVGLLQSVSSHLTTGQSLDLQDVKDGLPNRSFGLSVSSAC